MGSFKATALVVGSGVLMLAFSTPAFADREAFELLTRNPVTNSLPSGLNNSDNPAIPAD